ncbi:unnamed protein product [Polarella glacialis]|uniref:Uncharacterized protein n=1 Tax=Polarella glacialis TaxID=89957 RepID=A0A813K0C6_POLGL|nr:unnamed protein product [Polarella glacialis]
MGIFSPTTVYYCKDGNLGFCGKKSDTTCIEFQAPDLCGVAPTTTATATTTVTRLTVYRRLQVWAMGVVNLNRQMTAWSSTYTSCAYHHGVRSLQVLSVINTLQICCKDEAGKHVFCGSGRCPTPNPPANNNNNYKTTITTTTTPLLRLLRHRCVPGMARPAMIPPRSCCHGRRLCLSRSSEIPGKVCKYALEGDEILRKA